ncbi:MAG: rRNA maturation RNase YbeY [Planctomycetota bacterium]
MKRQSVIMASAEQDSDIVIQIARNFKDVNVPLPRLRKLLKTALDRFAVSKTRGAGYVVDIAIVDDSQIRQLNNRFKNRDATTDCLSFDLSDDRKEPDAGSNAPRVLEVIVNGQMAARQANLRGHSGEAELALYITHGLLHCLGFDDSTRTEARKMHEAEDEILQQLGYGLVYNRDIREQE